MTDQAGLGDLSQLLDEVKQAREAMAANHAQRAASMDELKAHIAKQDKAINARSIKLGRPNGRLELDDTRTQAICTARSQTPAALAQARDRHRALIPAQRGRDRGGDARHQRREEPFPRRRSGQPHLR